MLPYERARRALEARACRRGLNRGHKGAARLPHEIGQRAPTIRVRQPAALRPAALWPKQGPAAAPACSNHDWQCNSRREGPCRRRKRDAGPVPRCSAKRRRPLTRGRELAWSRAGEPTTSTSEMDRPLRPPALATRGSHWCTCDCGFGVVAFARIHCATCAISTCESRRRGAAVAPRPAGVACL